MIRRVQADVVLEADTAAKTLALVVQTPAADGEGDVEVYRVPLDVSGTENADKRRRLRDVFAAP